MMTRPTKTPKAISRAFLSLCDFFGGSPHPRPFQYARPSEPAGSGYQPGRGDDGVVIAPSTILLFQTPRVATNARRALQCSRGLSLVGGRTPADKISAIMVEP